ncbi:hypothetical protein HPP92_016008 [Vanilla planifolia]|uniref:beta-glucosidase n=1 Tax=Vanilla planifolia TaxID=51239 RepID=A0A835QPG1_VANPL|nr:hypothetical protein HPP92_016625 [Vanilla planifolia]KAG0471462.1 hypothetical protein HPP92_016008 [Vanilla planifolia]
MIDSIKVTIPELGLSIIIGVQVVIEPYVENMDALVAAWLPGTECSGMTDVLFQVSGFTGKLPRTVRMDFAVYLPSFGWN